MTSIEIGELKRLAACYAMERVMPFEDVTGLASALVRRYLPGLRDNLDDYAASWDASREDPDGCTWPEWATSRRSACSRPSGGPPRRRRGRTQRGRRASPGPWG